MLKVKVYNSEGKAIKDRQLAEKVFKLPLNLQLVKQVVVAQQSNQRGPISHSKDRSEVRGGGRKPWRQKGTGRARHGSIRSPLWAGGGVTFGPTKERNWRKKVTKSSKRQAICMVLSDKVAAGRFYLIDKFALTEIKTKKFKSLLNKLPVKSEKTLIVIEGKNEQLEKSGRNLPQLKIIKVNNINVLDILNYPNILLTEVAIDKLEKVYDK